MTYVFDYSLVIRRWIYGKYQVIDAKKEKVNKIISYNSMSHIVNNSHSVQFFILYLNCLYSLADFIVPGSVFQSILPLNFSELFPYLNVLLFGNWTRSFILKL